MNEPISPARGLSRRDMLALTGSAAAAALTGQAAAQAPAPIPGKTFRIGVISAAILGKPQPRNGHTWHFAQYLHPEFDVDALKRHDPNAVPIFKNYLRNPQYTFDQLPFPDTRITQYYDAYPKAAVPFTEVFPGVKVAENLKQMVEEVDAIWLGDASGYGEDHFDLVAPGLAKGLPTFCDKPIGGSVTGTRKILEFARAHQAPLMSANIFRFEWGMEAAKRMRDSGEFGEIEHVSARMNSRYSSANWSVYGQHPLWTIISLMGAGVEAVSMYEHVDTCHGFVTFQDRYPCHFWWGQPAEKFEYDRTDVYYKKKYYSYTPSIEGSFNYGYHYSMFRMANTFRHMVQTRVEPVPHQEILEVTAMIHAGAKSAQEQSRLVKLSEVMG
jgi:predicted dehydrogenase